MKTGSRLFFSTGILIAALSSASAQKWTLRTADTTENLAAVVWNGREFIATGGQGVLLVSANGGNTWRDRGTMPTAGAAHSLIWVEDRVIASNAGGKLFHSTDLASWTEATVQFPSPILDLAWDGRRVVASSSLTGLAGHGPATGTHLFSMAFGAITTTLRSVASNGEFFVGVGEGGAILTSVAGEPRSAWVARPSPTTKTLHKVRWSGERFLAVGDDGAFVHSSDGVTWAGATIGGGTVALKSVAEKPAPAGSLVVVGAGGAVFTAPTVGDPFTRVPPADIPTTSTLNDVIWNGLQFVAVGDGGTVITDGRLAGHPLITRHPEPGEAVIAAGTALTLKAQARGGTSVLWQSAPDAAGAWTALPAAVPGSNTDTVTVTPEATRYYRFVAVDGDVMVFSRPVRVTVEPPGNGWVRRVPPAALDGVGLATALGSDGRHTYVAGPDGRVFYSIDGRNWLEVLTSTGTPIQDFAAGPDSLVAVTLQPLFGGGIFPNGAALYSTDPRWWPMSAGASNVARRKVSWGPGGFVSANSPLAGPDGVNVSADGSLWGPLIAFPGAPADDLIIRDICWDGDDFRITSTLGSHYKFRPGIAPTREPLAHPATPQADPLIRKMVRWRDREIFIEQNDRSLYSTADGLTLTRLTTPDSSYFMRGLAANRERIVVVGNRTPAGGGGAVLLTSVDGVNFTDETPPGAGTALLDVHWNGAQFIVTDGGGGFWTLGPAGTGPCLLSVPNRVAAWPGTPVTLEVIARGENLRYQWYENSNYSTAGAPVFIGGPVFEAGVITTPTTYWVRVIGDRGVNDSPLIRVTPGVTGRDFETHQTDGPDIRAFLFDGLNAYSAASDGVIRRAPSPYTNWSVVHTQAGASFNAAAFGAGGPLTGSHSVFVGNGGVIVHYDGFTWNARTSGTSTNLNAVIWTGRHFFIAGDGGTILRSADGITWTSVTPTGRAGFVPPAENLNGAAFDGNFLVFIGDEGLILRSQAPALDNSTLRVSGTTQPLKSIVWDRGKFLAVGHRGTVLQADQGGGVWTARPLPPPPQGNQPDLFAVAVDWTSGGYLALGENAFLYHSADGVTWERRRVPTGGGLRTLTWNGGHWLAAGTDGTYRTSGRAVRTPLGISILQHPQNATIPSGSTASLSYAARGPGIWATWTGREAGAGTFGAIAASNDVRFTTPALTADHEYRVTLESPWSDRIDTNIAQITVTVSITGFPKWLADRGYTNPDPNDDPGNFGLPNLLRYALNLPDTRPEALAALGSPTIVNDNGAFLQLLYTKLAGLTDATVEVRFSRDLVEWKPLSELGGTDTQTGSDGPTTERRRARLPTAGEPQLYLRITATLP